jgi:hypothetical protein
VYGEAKEIKVKRSGILWLTMNDDAPEGNVGNFDVTITVIKPEKKLVRPRATSIKTTRSITHVRDRHRGFWIGFLPGCAGAISIA